MADTKENPVSVTRKTAIEAHCWQCLGFWDDKNRDCENPRCPLYPFQPYRKMDADEWWTVYNHRRKGKVIRTKREATPEQIAALEKGRR